MIYFWVLLVNKISNFCFSGVDIGMVGMEEEIGNSVKY